MIEEVDKLTGDSWIKLSKKEIEYGFLSQCIEAVAEAEKCSYLDIFERMENVNMTEGYVLAHYNVLHTESMENVVAELVDLLHKRESNKEYLYV